MIRSIGFLFLFPFTFKTTNQLSRTKEKCPHWMSLIIGKPKQNDGAAEGYFSCCLLVDLTYFSKCQLSNTIKIKRNCNSKLYQTKLLWIQCWFLMCWSNSKLKFLMSCSWTYLGHYSYRLGIVLPFYFIQKTKMYRNEHSIVKYIIPEWGIFNINSIDNRYVETRVKTTYDLDLIVIQTKVFNNSKLRTEREDELIQIHVINNNNKVIVIAHAYW